LKLNREFLFSEKLYSKTTSRDGMIAKIESKMMSSSMKGRSEKEAEKEREGENESS